MTEDKGSSKQPDQPTNGKDNKPQMKWSEWFPRENDSINVTLEVIGFKGITVFQSKDEKK